MTLPDPITIPPWPGATVTRRTPSPNLVNQTALPVHQQVRPVPARNRHYGIVYGETWVACDPDIVEEKNGHYYLRGIISLGALDSILAVEIAGDTYSTTNPEASGSYRGDWSDAAIWDPPNNFPYAAQAGEIYLFNGLYYQVNQPFTVDDNTGQNTPTGTAYRSYFDRIYANTTVNGYAGTAGQGVDPLMVEYFGASYTETLTGTWYGQAIAHAYVTAKIPVEEFDSGWPSMRVLARGVPCFDPRTQSWGFTRNPALHLADFIQSPLYGLGKPVNWDTVSAAADRCEDAFADGPRIECNLAIAGAPVSTRRWLEVLRGYAGVLLDYRDGQYDFVVDGPREADWSVNWDGRGADMDLQGLPPIEGIRAADRKNVYRVKYTDTTTTPWKEATVEAVSEAVQSGAEIANVQDLRMPGLLVKAQAQRFADERLAESELETWLTTIPVADLGQAVQTGHVLYLDSPNGFEGDCARVLAKNRPSEGLWLLRCRQYHPDSYLEP